jgi:hypothetical protein
MLSSIVLVTLAPVYGTYGFRSLVRRIGNTRVLPVALIDTYVCVCARAQCVG